MADLSSHRAGFAADRADSGPYSKAELEALRYMGNSQNPQSKPFHDTVRGLEKVEWPRTGIFDIGTDSQVAQRSIAQVRLLGEAAPANVDLRVLADKVREHMPQDPKEQEVYLKNLTEGHTFDFAKHEARKAEVHAVQTAEELEAGKTQAREQLRTQLTAPGAKPRAAAKSKGFDKIKGDQAATPAKTPDGKICGAFASIDKKPADCAAVDKAALAPPPAAKEPGAVKVKTVKIGAQAKMDLHGFH